MEFKDLAAKTRSCRRFYHDRAVSGETLAALIDIARRTPSGANMQPLKYKTVTAASHGKQTTDSVFSCLGWAGYLPEWQGPSPDEQPSGYIIMLHDTAIKPATLLIDTGIAAQTILLGAAEAGLGGCFIGNIKKEKLASVLALPAAYDILLVIALGYPKEHIELEDIPAGQSIRYYRDRNAVHHVPKRALQDILI